MLRRLWRAGGAHAGFRAGTRAGDRLGETCDFALLDGSAGNPAGRYPRPHSLGRLEEPPRSALPSLFSPLSIKGVSIRNRILSTGHDTALGRHGPRTGAL